MNASGSVRAIFPQTPRASGARGTDRVDVLAPALAPAPVNTAQTKAQAKRPQLWQATCGTLAYHENESRAHLEQNVVVQSAEQRMRAPVLDLYFTRSAPPVANSGGAPTLETATYVANVDEIWRELRGCK